MSCAGITCRSHRHTWQAEPSAGRICFALRAPREIVCNQPLQRTLLLLVSKAGDARRTPRQAWLHRSTSHRVCRNVAATCLPKADCETTRHVVGGDAEVRVAPLDHVEHGLQHALLESTDREYMTVVGCLACHSLSGHDPSRRRLRLGHPARRHDCLNYLKNVPS
jgi:hypothetical protein